MVVLIIFPVILQTDINVIMQSTGSYPSNVHCSKSVHSKAFHLIYSYAASYQVSRLQKNNKITYVKNKNTFYTY